MTDRSSGTPPRPEAVRRSLRSLADGSAPSREPTAGSTAPEVGSVPPESVVEDAERAVRCARDAASFLSGGRLPDLDRAIAAAARRGDDDVASRGRIARNSLRRLADALSGGASTEPAGDADRAAGPPARDDRFRSGRGTVLGDTAQRPDR
ncbi:hypothetical protein [Halobellus ruber]|uniref:Uncharacterized protein n=1 Tax=Halobellus ruber TaxID=2761102 RepID=A0A7J9SIH4_9EURY|nr:hypothetical protein [Halobellus ruber]MBB6645816.1 hypothetical protein [Halobellus ruber]